MASYPDATNTGVPSGVTLTASGGMTITKAGTVIKGLNITGPVVIAADNVTLEDCKITTNSFSAVKINSGITGAVVQDCTINGTGVNNAGDTGIVGQGTFLRNNIYNVENGFSIAGDNTIIKDNYVHDLKASGSPHYDGIQLIGGESNTSITHNTILNENNQTSAVMIQNLWGPVSNVVVDNNVLTGGGYTVYSDGRKTSDPITGVQVTNNHMGGGQYGDTMFANNKVVYTGNVDDGVSIAKTLHSTGAPSGTGDDSTTGSGSTTPPPSGSTPPAGSGSTPAPSPAPGTGATTSSSGVTSHHNDTGSTSLTGTSGNDTLVDLSGKTVMMGNAGADHFVFNSVSTMGTSATTRDIIADFIPGQDKIDLSGIDANSKVSGNSAFTFLSGNDQSFTHTAGQLAWRTDASTHQTIIQGDLNGDGVHDFEIQLSGIHNLAASDFIL